jgi:glucosamine-6-phosphate deaminase
MPVREFELRVAHIEIYDDAATACRAAAERIASIIEHARGERGRAVLGLATGNTPIRVYEHLVRMHREGNLSFEHVHTFNLDEYYPMSAFDPNSYRRYMHERLFEAVGLESNQTHVFDGSVPAAYADEHAAQFDRWIEAEGGLDLQLLGIGRNGHIGFNEPVDLPVEEALTLGSRLVELHPITKEDAALEFGSPLAVPDRALTMGPATILGAREILVLAFGERKSEVVGRALGPEIGMELPATLLQRARGRVTWILDPAAASAL